MTSPSPSSPTPFPTSASELLFPTSSSLSTTLANLSRSSTSCSNRLSSIAADASFVTDVANTFPLPLIANERCGSWYIPPGLKAGSAYFKSTDGHTGNWAFSCRRLNLQLLGVIAERNGCIIVDSTRRGKSMPDALSKTIPIWCAVLNRLLFGEGEVHVPEHLVGESERAQMNARIEGWVEEARALNLDLPHLRQTLSKPLRPFWITPTSISADLVLPSAPSNCHRIICLTASRFMERREAADAKYVQGAADDSESWAHGLTPNLFWRHEKELLGTGEDELPGLIRRLCEGEKDKGAEDGEEERPVLIQPTSNLFLGSTRTGSSNAFDATITCSETSTTSPTATSTSPSPPETNGTGNPNTLILNCGTGKLGSRALRTQLARIPPFIHALRARIPHPTLLFTCSSGKDLSAGVALAVLCLYFDQNGNWRDGDMDAKLKESSVEIDKGFIRRRLAWLTMAKPDVNPSRATLQAVNGFLMPRS